MLIVKKSEEKMCLVLGLPSAWSRYSDSKFTFNIVETVGSSPRSSEILQKILETEIRGETFLIIDRPLPLATRRVSWTFFVNIF
jgi:hypothetical protein